jgi:hypothetical protein
MRNKEQQSGPIYYTHLWWVLAVLSLLPALTNYAKMLGQNDMFRLCSNTLVFLSDLRVQ